ncbi:LysE family translocator [Tabrizicola piscis]|uniref:LysE family translocator n=1 Tax=Tabrizicola piscis TaxID=2494374 RepID=A0A3S8U7C5_9RHOB|nr:LysE family translocator [Tabrizicola piscis]AZL59477.1 LysE family translocator [Tabrizicola piscis]
MTVSLYELTLYAWGMAALWVVPGPVWVALTARSLSFGFRGAWPLAIGVALGDLIWPMAAIFGLSWILSLYGDFLQVLRWVAAATFLLMGVLLLRKPATTLDTDNRLTRPGAWAGFAVGVAAVIGNPKAILFYMGVLPGFFDLSRVNAADITAILLISALIPMIGNLALAWFLDRARRLLSSPEAMRRLNMASGILLIGVGLAIPFV